ncbi:hypothetical protein COU17_00300 [Candidatus Kaiserbacteria bacterium CG10_big_fil_rev_8_21_14_0_10_49_17]|uniref:HD/PDEase domain-containing protein n=1 Tax=Candidatus Kaiserbacteria bacterium CG10_big_fil_rev_8_21_14_0_10_49_17 TaxID=1974609 RepID=A0A2M6WF59_9BACT|nr:MAG: hypothetical protein COU17_00300 [Candidatus Kaiserbacteria bacterium CG10_big_fil_rev_8_21_14_0_10_49_17]
MHFTPEIEKALEKVARVHEGQYRKGEKKTPYITHLVSVAWIVSEYCTEEDVIIAALLHDIVEDTNILPEEIEEEFGARVKNIVLGVTIPQAIGATEWEKSRRAYGENLQKAPLESAIVAAADKIHNFSNAIREFSGHPDDFKNQFSGNIDDRIYVYGALVAIISEKLGEHPLRVRLNETFDEYKSFLESLR